MLRALEIIKFYKKNRSLFLGFVNTLELNKLFPRGVMRLFIFFSFIFFFFFSRFLSFRFFPAVCLFIFLLKSRRDNTRGARCRISYIKASTVGNFIRAACRAARSFKLITKANRFYWLKIFAKVVYHSV